MFRMVTGGNGRTVYCGRVGKLSAAGFTLSGVEYDPEIDAEVSVVLELRFDAELPENAKKIKDGDQLGGSNNVTADDFEEDDDIDTDLD